MWRLVQLQVDPSRGKFQLLVENVEVMMDHCHGEVEGQWLWVIESCFFHPAGSQGRMQLEHRDGEYKVPQAEDPSRLVWRRKKTQMIHCQWHESDSESESAVCRSSCALRGCVLFVLIGSGTSENSHRLDKQATRWVHDDKTLDGEPYWERK